MSDNNILTPEYVRRKVDEIGEYPDTYSNHDLEDALYKRVLQAIAAGRCSDPAACAELALKTQEFHFPRYTA